MSLQQRDRIVLAIESTRTLQHGATVYRMDPFSYVDDDGQTHSYAGSTSTASAKSAEITEYHPTRTIDLPNPTGTITAYTTMIAVTLTSIINAQTGALSTTTVTAAAATYHEPKFTTDELFGIIACSIIFGLPALGAVVMAICFAFSRLLEIIEVKRFGAEYSPRRHKRLGTQGPPERRQGRQGEPRCDAPKPPSTNTAQVEEIEMA